MRAASGRFEGEVANEDRAICPIVLPMEDDPLLATSLSDYIEAAGCDVVEARTACEAIHILERGRTSVSSWRTSTRGGR